MLLILGCGRGVGLGTAKVFARSDEFSHIICVSRTPKNQEDLGLKIKWRHFDCLSEASVNENVALIEKEIGPVKACIYNLGCNLGFRSLETTKVSTLKRALDRGAVGAFIAAKALKPYFEKRFRAASNFQNENNASLNINLKLKAATTVTHFFGLTGATASLRATETQLAHAAAMFARRAVAQALHLEFKQMNVHVSHLIVDDIIHSPDTVGKMLGREIFEGEEYKRLKDERKGVVLGEDVGKAYFYLYQQERSAWTLEMELRSGNSKPWWASTASDINLRAKI